MSRNSVAERCMFKGCLAYLLGSSSSTPYVADRIRMGLACAAML